MMPFKAPFQKRILRGGCLKSPLLAPTDTIQLKAHLQSMESSTGSMHLLAVGIRVSMNQRRCGNYMSEMERESPYKVCEGRSTPPYQMPKNRVTFDRFLSNT